VYNKSVDQVMTFEYLGANIARNLKEDDQSSRDVCLSARYNSEKQAHELKQQDDDM